MTKKFYRIAIDGPSGAGKSSLAKYLTRKLRFLYIDTGALYRSVGYFFYINNLECTDSGDIKTILNLINIDLAYEDDTQKVFLNNEEITGKIRDGIVSKYASDISKIPAVRGFLAHFQTEKIASNNIIMDGRDIGTVIMPNADVKIYLTASIEARARRRYEELYKKDSAVDYQDIYDGIAVRDLQDSTREIAPLKIAEDAVIIDNSDMSEIKTLDIALKIIRERLPDVYIW